MITSTGSTEIFGIDLDVYCKLAAVPGVTVTLSPVVNVVYGLIAVPVVTESPVETVAATPVVREVYAFIAVPVVTESPVEKLPFVIVKTP